MLSKIGQTHKDKYYVFSHIHAIWQGGDMKVKETLFGIWKGKRGGEGGIRKGNRGGLT
jgi:hypothetical protein